MVLAVEGEAVQGEKKSSRSMTEDKKKQYKVRMRMVEEDVMGRYKGVSFTSTEYQIKDISMCVTGNIICGVLRESTIITTQS